MTGRRNNNKISFFKLLSIVFEKQIFTPLFIIVPTTIFMAIFFITFKDDIAVSNRQLFLIVPAVVVTLFVVSNGLFKFLNTDLSEKKSMSVSNLILRHEIIERQKNIEKTIKEALNENPEILNVEKAVYDKVVTNLEASIINKLDDKFQKNVKAEFVTNLLIKYLDPLTNNIEKYIDRIQRNSIVNLFIGIIGTITAITILAFAILTNKEFNNLQDFFIHFLPRLTFVIFIQLFAFFFLRLYKNNLEDAKYFQNELTNLTAKSSSIQILNLLGSKSEISQIIKQLAVTERNFKLLKDETMIGLEKSKIESDFDKTIIDQFKDVISKFESKYFRDLSVLFMYRIAHQVIF